MGHPGHWCKQRLGVMAAMWHTHQADVKSLDTLSLVTLSMSLFPNLEDEVDATCFVELL